MNKPSIQSIALPSIYEKRVGDKFLDEESRATSDPHLKAQILQRSASLTIRNQGSAPQTYMSQQQEKGPLIKPQAESEL